MSHPVEARKTKQLKLKAYSNLQSLSVRRMDNMLPLARTISMLTLLLLRIYRCLVFSRFAITDSSL